MNMETGTDVTKNVPTVWRALELKSGGTLRLILSTHNVMDMTHGDRQLLDNLLGNMERYEREVKHD